MKGPMHELADPRLRRAGALLACAVAGVAVYLLLPWDQRQQAIASEILAMFSCAVASAVIWRRGGDWPSARHLAWLFVLVGVANLLFFLRDLADAGSYRPSSWDLLFLILLVPLGLSMLDELRAHFGPQDRREIAIDAGLVSASLAAIAYTLMHPPAGGAAAASTAVFALIAAAVITSFGTLTLWIPTMSHRLLLLAMTPAALAALRFGWEWGHGTFDGSSPGVDVPFLLTPLAAAAVITAIDHGSGDRAPSRLARPIATSVSVVSACAALAVVSLLDERQGIAGAQSTLVILALGAGVAARIVANQRASSQAHEEVREALARREAALGEADRALERVRETNETLRRSEEHLRLVFDAAVDGFVELDDRGTIVRANDAFAKMVGLDRDDMEGQPWFSVAVAVTGADAGFAELPETGQAQIQRPEGQPLFLESRMSRVPSDPPRRLLLVRDVTAAKVADQTIRSLFQFLQDRDEDRTRLMRRSNAAIEQERNRIARDLHDGPVQGVSAASLSLEAALLMIKAGDVDRGLDVLAKIRQELAGEADALRRLMAGLRPPVLEERGLMPALRETLLRFGEESGVMTEFTGRLSATVPDDLETLAYRVVQEALANVAKHADADHVLVHVETDQNQLRIDVEDDGRGFDTAQSRDFLHEGRVGLASMRERVELASGTFAVRSTPGRGTAVMATIPLDVALVPVSVS
jgi:PAS domain S-box-containing protein